ncbi:MULTISPECIES: helix-hairpin-helix domain-containing protein [unclassified Photobacterium]|uniref:ComEA family DNA-binding protein n=1 Tax=unclassified Photobacterium TaxID=2628852 RepID=UPI001EDEE7DD|nr:MULTISPECIES: helix-hairpin-helix domain-containing protein [unclassified Photobacterium]MCG3864765.1 helix-hairpin-helix domain-containing protein [Photobacterium sp. Ph6]MCG3876174.1 helix-hairpin-helix domain-containing protein [Photobacterium sp. Ph5]
MFKKLLLTLAFILPFASQAASTDTTKLIKKCETKYKADKQKKMDCITKVKKSAKKDAEKAKKTSTSKVTETKKDLKATSSKLDSKKDAVKKSATDAKKTTATKSKTAVKKQLKAVNVNTASASELAASLPGIGEAKAKAIVDYRKKHGKFKSTKDLEKVTGLGEKSVSSMKKYLKF